MNCCRILDPRSWMLDKGTLHRYRASSIQNPVSELHS